MSSQNSGHVWMIDPSFHVDWAHCVHDDYCVFVVVGDVFDELVSIVPQFEVIAITGITFHSQKAFARIRIDKDDCGVAV